jgi:hypothetical protein
MSSFEHATYTNGIQALAHAEFAKNFMAAVLILLVRPLQDTGTRPQRQMWGRCSPWATPHSASPLP